MDTQTKGLIFDIQGHSVHDGPGSRTTVFLKGCPLSCFWCCNPEGINKQKDLMYYRSRCIGCGKCVEACPNHAISYDAENSKVIHNRDICDKCKDHICTQVCLNEASCEAGRWYNIDEMMKIFQRDRHFWGDNGGVTFSGGEPLYQREFILALLKKCKQSYIHTCIETTSHVQPDFFDDVINYVDWVFTDIKHMDSEQHKKGTGIGNHRILDNIERLAKRKDWNGVVIVRVPIIPDFNDTEENIRETSRFIKRIGLDALNLLPFHRMGESKYNQLDKTYPCADYTPPSDEKMSALKKIAEAEGIYCFVGYKTPF